MDGRQISSFGENHHVHIVYNDEQTSASFDVPRILDAQSAQPWHFQETLGYTNHESPVGRENTSFLNVLPTPLYTGAETPALMGGSTLFEASPTQPPLSGNAHHHHTYNNCSSHLDAADLNGVSFGPAPTLPIHRIAPSPPGLRPEVYASPSPLTTPYRASHAFQAYRTDAPSALLRPSAAGALPGPHLMPVFGCLLIPCHPNGEPIHSLHDNTLSSGSRFIPIEEPTEFLSWYTSNLPTNTSPAYAVPPTMRFPQNNPRGDFSGPLASSAHFPTSRVNHGQTTGYSREVIGVFGEWEAISQDTPVPTGSCQLPVSPLIPTEDLRLARDQSSAGPSPPSQTSQKGKIGSGASGSTGSGRSRGKARQKAWQPSFEGMGCLDFGIGAQNDS